VPAVGASTPAPTNHFSPSFLPDPIAADLVLFLRRQKNHPPMIRMSTNMPPIAMPAIAPPPRLFPLGSDAASVGVLLLDAGFVVSVPDARDLVVLLIVCDPEFCDALSVCGVSPAETTLRSGSTVRETTLVISMTEGLEVAGTSKIISICLVEYLWWRRHERNIQAGEIGSLTQEHCLLRGNNKTP
jgi:hypothetical protein